jgi:hypothetical protein
VVDDTAVHPGVQVLEVGHLLRRSP